MKEWCEKITQYAPYAALSIIAASIVIALSIQMVRFAAPHLLDGTYTYIESSYDMTTNGIPNYFRNLLELFYFVGSTVAILFTGYQAYIAAYALKESQRTNIESQRTNIAQNFILLQTRWEEEKIQDGLRGFTEIMTEFYRENPMSENPEGAVVYTKEHFEKMKKFADTKMRSLRDSKNEKEKKWYDDTMSIVGYFDNIGFLLHRKDVSLKEIDFLIGAFPIDFYEILEKHLDGRRDAQHAYEFARNRPKSPAPYSYFEYLVHELKKRHA